MNTVANLSVRNWYLTADPNVNLFRPVSHMDSFFFYLVSNIRTVHCECHSGARLSYMYVYCMYLCHQKIDVEGLKKRKIKKSSMPPRVIIPPKRSPELVWFRAGKSASAWQRRWEPSKGPESRSRTVDAKLESNSEPERARVCQRVAVRASESQSGSHREP